MIDQKRVEELDLQKKSLLEEEEESLDEDGYSKHDPYAETAKKLSKLSQQNTVLNE